MEQSKFHLSLNVSNIEESLTFYEGFFQRSADKVKDDYFKFDLNEPALTISFVYNPKAVASQFGHIGFRLENDTDVFKEMERVKKLGCDVIEEKDVNCCYARQDKFWVKDPNGYDWEVYSFHEDVEFNDPKARNSTGDLCCTPNTKVTKPKMSIEAFKQLDRSECNPKSGCC